MAWLGGWAQIAATGPAAPNRPGRPRLPAVYRSWRGRPDDRFWGRRDAPEPRPTPGKRRGSPRRPGGGQRGRGVALQGAGSTTDWVVIRRACAPGRRRGNPWMSKTDNRAAANDGDGKETSRVRPERAARASAEPSGLRGRRGACDPTRPQAAVVTMELRLRIETETRQAAPPAGSALLPEPEETCRIAAPTAGKRPAVPGPARPHRPGANTGNYGTTWVPGLWGRAAVTKILPVSFIPVTADARC